MIYILFIAIIGQLYIILVQNKMIRDLEESLRNLDRLLRTFRSDS